MIDKFIKKICAICLGLASLALVGCFHVPDEDWLLNDGEIKSNSGKNNDLNQAFDSFVSDFNNISDQRTEIKNNENDGMKDGDLGEVSIDTGDQIVNNKNVVNEENVVEKEENNK